MEALSGWYLWAKALHIISVMAWMAGMLYLPRLFVYHCGAAPGSAQSETFKVMERRLMNVIINPALVAAWGFGLVLVATPGIVDWSTGWPWAKLALLFLLQGFHGALMAWRRRFAEDRNTKSEKFYRVANEIPTLLMVGIVILIVVKPF